MSTRARWLAALAAGVILLALAVSAFLSARVLAPSGRSAVGHGDAVNATGAVGFSVDVVGTDGRDGVLALRLRFRNTSNQQQRADPADFALRSGSGRDSGPVFDSGCPDWGRVDLYPTQDESKPLRDPGGTRAGPEWEGVLCFRDPGPGGPLRLVWTPDVAFGPLSGTVLIVLPSPSPS